MVLSCDAKFHYCRKTNVKETVESVLNDIRKEGLKPYYIYGDSTGKGNEHTPMLAYAKLYEEIKGQYDYIFLATGTGMTQGDFWLEKQSIMAQRKYWNFSCQICSTGNRGAPQIVRMFQ